MRHLLLLAGLALVPVVASARADPQYVWRTSKDLDGDGRREAISLTLENEARGIFTVHVGGEQVRDRLGEGLRGLRIVDVDRRDRYKEIAVHTDGPSDDYAELLLWYDGKHLHRVGLVEGWVEVAGDGRVVGREHHEFWTLPRPYRLGRDHRLREVPQRYYGLDVAANVLRPFALYREATRRSAVATVRPGARVRLLRYDSRRDVYYGRTDRGVYGWLRVTPELMALPYAD